MTKGLKGFRGVPNHPGFIRSLENHQIYNLDDAHTVSLVMDSMREENENKSDRDLLLEILFRLRFADQSSRG